MAERALAFGSCAKGTARETGDADIAIALMPPQGKHDWAAGNLLALGPEWKKQLEAIVCRDVDLSWIRLDTDLDSEVRKTGKLLWIHA
jgi:predicted nucleotidyltransferase